MWFGLLQAEEEAEARFLTLWASAFANSILDKMQKVCAPLPWFHVSKRVSKAQFRVLADVSPQEWARPFGT